MAVQQVPRLISTYVNPEDWVHVGRVIILINFLNKMRASNIYYSTYAPKGFNGKAKFVQWIGNNDKQEGP